MKNPDFFNEQRDQSRVKAKIVSEYFDAWANVITNRIKKNNGNLAYIDLYAGPGCYNDPQQQKSTPILIMEQVINDPYMRDHLIAIFNDINPENIETLKDAIGNIPNIEKLRHSPQYFKEEVDDSLIDTISGIGQIPALIFMDPWGYKGITLQNIKSFLKLWGTDCIIFFNYSRVNMTLSNKDPQALKYMNDLFGENFANKLREELDFIEAPYERQCAVIEMFLKSLKSIGGDFPLPFCFKDERGNRTSHHLIFVSKHFLGYEIMKRIMAKYSSQKSQGVPAFEYNPAIERFPVLFEFTKDLDELEEILLKTFAGQTLSMKDIYEQHNVGRRFIEKNYKDALKKLHEKGKIEARRPLGKEIRKGTFPDDIEVTFPKRK